MTAGIKLAGDMGAALKAADGLKRAIVLYMIQAENAGEETAWSAVEHLADAINAYDTARSEVEGV